jgi:hypothetical protein
METVQYKIILLSLALLLAPLSGYTADRNLTVLSSSSSEFRFVYSFASEFEASASADGSSDPQLLVRVIQVALPAGADAYLISANGLTVSDVTVLAPSRDQAVPHELATLGRPIEIRGRRFVGVKISPISGGTAYEEIEVAVGFSRGPAEAALTGAAEDPGFDRIWAASIANYDVAKGWPIIDRRTSNRSAASIESSAILASSNDWHQVRFNRTGLVRMSGAQLAAAGISLNGLASDNIRFFTAGGLPLPLDNDEPRPELREVALLIVDGGDGTFDSGDQLYFFGESPDRWVYAADSVPEFVNNPYTANHTYWFTASGTFAGPPARMDQVNAGPNGGAAQTVNGAWHRIHTEEENIICTEPDGHIWDYYNWYWTEGPSEAAYFILPEATAGRTAYIHVQGRSNRNISLSVNGQPATRTGANTTWCTFESSALQGGDTQNRLDLSLPIQNNTVPGYLDFVEITYWGDLLPVRNEILFSLDSLVGATAVQVVDNFSQTPTVFDISDPLAPVVLTGYTRTGGLLTFQTEVTEGGTSRYYAAPLSAAVAVTATNSVEVNDPRLNPVQADLIIVTAAALESHLDEYIAYRESQGANISVIAVEDLMTCFAYGMYDPTAIRDYLKYAYENFPTPVPSAALFVGDASYDFMNHLGTGVTNLVPSYIRPGDRTYSDDNYVYFGDYGILDDNRDRMSDMMTARWPVRSAGEINTIVSKVVAYESPATLGGWRTRITLVSDDEHTRERDDELFHTTQTETLEKQYVPRALNRNKIYLLEYPFVNREKPEVNDAIVKAFDEGSLIVNYVGHGNPDVWSHELVFRRTTDLPRLHNAEKLPLVFAASCDIGFFDDPAREGMAEDLLVMPSGGAVGVVSATRLVYASDNAQFNRAVYTALFGDPDMTICEAMFAAKVERQYPNPSDTVPRPVDNDRAYNLLGDPLLRLGLPRLNVEFTERPDSLKALEASRVQGRIVDKDGVPYGGDGEIEITVFDADRERTYYLDDESEGLTYYVPGPNIFRGRARVTGGEFDFQFMTPLDVGYRGASARISVYAHLGNIDAIGLVDSLPVSETQAASEDFEGPEISYRLAGRSNYEPGDLLNGSDYLEITMSDPAGINLIGSVGHGITLTVDDRLESAVNLTDYFSYHGGDYTTGSLTYQLADFEPGPHDLKIKGWDNANNVSVLELQIEIEDDNSLVIQELLNYPNPMEDRTTFYFGLSQSAERVDLDIYTLSGKSIWQTSRYDLQADHYPNTEAEIVWNGCDGSGDRVATGVYIYRLQARSADRGNITEQFGKIIVLN